MQIRLATINDLPEIVSIYNQAIPGRQATADTELIPVESRTEWFYQHDSKRPLWVAEENEHLIGWISLQNFYGRPAYQKTVELSVYVSTENQKLGVAQKLISCAINECQSLCINVILGFIFSHNEASVKLFKKNGFDLWGHLPRVAELDGVEKDLMIFGRRLCEND